MDETKVLEIRSTVEEIPRVQADVQQDLNRSGINDDTCFAVKLALEESLVNAIRHGNQLDPTLHVHIQYCINDRCIKICVRDEGPGFDPARVPDPTSPENLTKTTGRGLMLIRAYMDSVAFNPRGNEVTMIKRRRNS
jgi:serine/threonine-protein kinase RsbW